MKKLVWILIALVVVGVAIAVIRADEEDKDRMQFLKQREKSMNGSYRLNREAGVFGGSRE